MISTIKELVDTSVRIYSGITIVHAQTSQELSLDCSWAPKFNGCYAVNNSTVAFVYKFTLYVIPYTRDVIKVLESSGFNEKTFFVPFSNWEYPKAESEYWASLRAKAAESYKEYLRRDCIMYSEQNSIGVLSKDILQNCLVIPESGIQVSTVHYTTTHFPLFTNFTDMHKVGKYDSNNGVVVFVYRDGTTYVARGYKIIKLLCDEGYTAGSFFVPLSNGEKIVNKAVAERWEALKKF